MNVQKRLAAQILNCGAHRVVFSSDSLEDIKEAVTKEDVRRLVKHGIISKKPSNSTSRFHARKIARQKRHGRRKGHGSRKGKGSARNNPKSVWMGKVRLQRAYLSSLRDNKEIQIADYHELYMKIKGGFFRSLRHLKLYVHEKGMLKK